MRYVTTSRTDAERTVCDFGRRDWSTWAMQAGTCRGFGQVGDVFELHGNYGPGSLVLVTRMAKSWRVSDVIRCSLAALKISPKNRRVSGGKLSASMSPTRLVYLASGMAGNGLCSTVGKFEAKPTDRSGWPHSPLPVIGAPRLARGMPPELISTRSTPEDGPGQARRMRCIDCVAFREFAIHRRESARRLTQLFLS